MLLARDIMTRDVVTVMPDMPLDEAGALLVDHRIHGAPVVDGTGRLVGMISMMDLVGRTGNVVADVMTLDPITAPEEAPVEELAGLMLGQAIRRIPIEQGGRVVGIVSASDIIGLFLNLHERAGGLLPESDALLRAGAPRMGSRRPSPHSLRNTGARRRAPHGVSRGPRKGKKR